MITALRLCWRALLRSPGFAAVAVGTLALGIGVNIAVFSLVKTFIWPHLQVPEPEQVVLVTTERPRNWGGLSTAEFLEVQARQRCFSALLVATPEVFLISKPGGEPERFWGEQMSAESVRLLRAKAQLGRWFGAEEDRPGAAPVVVLSHSYWRRHEASNRDIVGRQLKINGEWATVLGVAEEGFQMIRGPDAWMPLRLGATATGNREDRSCTVLGRLRPGVSRAQAAAELATIGAQVAVEQPETNREIRFGARSVREMVVKRVPANFQRMGFAALCVLLIACVNVANLLLARGAARQREMAVRLALGATRWSLARLYLGETLVLGGLGAVLGIGIGAGLLRVFIWQYQSGGWILPSYVRFDLDGRSVVYALALAGVSCLVTGMVPAWRLSAPDLNAALKDNARGATGVALGRFMRVLMVVEIALSAALLVLAAMTVRSVLNMASARLGYETAGVFSGRFYVAGAAHAGAERQLEFARALLERIRARPEVAAAGLAGALPVHDYWAAVVAENGAAGAAAQSVARAEIMGDYLGVLGIRLLQGRSIDERDTRTAEKVVLVNSVFAASAWPGQNPLGRRVRFGQPDDAKPAPWLTVVGVVTPTLPGAFAQKTAGQVYVPLVQQNEAGFLCVLTKARGGDAAQLAGLVRQALHGLDPDLALLDPEPLDKVVARVRQGRRLWAPTYLVFGVISLVLAGVGLYGVMSYSVSRRVPEIGVRVALGATPGQVAWLIARQAGGQLLGGLLLGSLVAHGAAWQFGTYFFDVSPHDPMVYLVVGATLGFAAIVACAVPVGRALRVSPIEALRCE